MLLFLALADIQNYVFLLNSLLPFSNIHHQVIAVHKGIFLTFSDTLFTLWNNFCCSCFDADTLGALVADG